MKSGKLSFHSINVPFYARYFHFCRVSPKTVKNKGSNFLDAILNFKSQIILNLGWQFKIALKLFTFSKKTRTTVFL